MSIRSIGSDRRLEETEEDIRSILSDGDLLVNSRKDWGSVLVNDSEKFVQDVLIVDQVVVDCLQEI